MSRLAIGTIVARNYLAFARVLAYSLQRHHPDVPFYVLVVDADESELATDNELFHPLTLSDLGDRAQHVPLFSYECKQVLVSLKPTFMLHLLDAGFPSVLFLDADMLVLDSLDEFLDQVATHALTLSPHVLTVTTNEYRRKRERALLLAGIYNGGVVGVSRETESICFLKWWQTRLFSHCDDNVRQGLHYDQRWLDFAPSFVTDLHLIRDPGINLAYWNLPDINSSIDGGHFLVNGVPCRLFHFSGFNPEFPEDVSRYVPGLTMEELGPYATLYAQYREQLISMGHEQVSLIPWRWETFNNGARISLAARQHYRMMGDESQRFGDPFDAHSRSSYYRWFMGPKYFSLRIRRALRKYPRKIWEGLFNRMDRY